MISEQTPLPTMTRIETTHISATPIPLRLPVVVAGVLQRVAANLRGWARVPVLPYAALWEASVITGMLAASVLGIFLVPVLFVVVERIAKKKPHVAVAQPALLEGEHS